MSAGAWLRIDREGTTRRQVVPQRDKEGKLAIRQNGVVAYRDGQILQWPHDEWIHGHMDRFNARTQFKQAEL